jgi:hypothetical protein
MMAKGDHIKVKRMHGLYYHHGIDMGDGTVIHFSGEPLNAKLAQVIQDSEEDFLKGEEKQVIAYTDCTDVLTTEETVLLAREQLDTEGYNLIDNNCEHFATYCKTRYKRSGQVQGIKKKLMVIAGMATAVAFVMIANQIRKKLQQGRA